MSQNKEQTPRIWVQQDCKKFTVTAYDDQARDFDTHAQNPNVNPN